MELIVTMYYYFLKAWEIKETCNYANTKFCVLFCILVSVTYLILAHASLTIIGNQLIL